MGCFSTHLLSVLFDRFIVFSYTFPRVEIIRSPFVFYFGTLYDDTWMVLPTLLFQVNVSHDFDLYARETKYLRRGSICRVFHDVTSIVVINIIGL